MRAVTLVRRATAAAAGGALLVGAAWAGVGLVPVSTGEPEPPLPVASPAATAAAESLTATETGDRPTPPDLSGLTRLPAGEFLAGASVRSLAPDPERWQTEGCSEYASNFPDEVAHLADKAVTDQTGSWPKSPDCIYLGGYGIGPARAATGVDPHAGINVRSLAVSNGEDTVVWQMIDMVGYFNKYRADLCDDCGILDLRRTIAGAVDGLDEADVAIGSTHTHGGADGYGAWGGLPTWYREQVRDAAIDSAYEALAAMRPATIDIGATDARPFNNERRDTYYSSADYEAVWLQARALAPANGGGSPGKTKKKDQPAPGPDGGEVIATLVNYAAHPVVLGAQPLLHGDWPATAAKAMGDQLGGVGLVFEGGLGNVSPSVPERHDHDGDGEVDDYDEVISMGDSVSRWIGADIARGGTRLAANDIRAATVDVEHPVTNWAEAALGVAGLLDREFLPGDAAGVAGAYRWSKKSPTTEQLAGEVTDGDSDLSQRSSRSCATAAPNTIITQVSGYRVGDLTVLTGPGELFSTMSEVVKSKARLGALRGGQTMVFAQTQDSLGYIIQSFEVDPAGGVATNVDVADYEETFMLDRCFGDHVLQTQLDLIGQLRIPADG